MHYKDNAEDPNMKGAGGVRCTDVCMSASPCVYVCVCVYMCVCRLPDASGRRL